jgi:ribosomal protein S18 acetylase RimI-like enzyme
MQEISIRRGTLADIDFVATCIIEAEGAGKEQSSYEKIFGLSKEELRTSLMNMLEEEAPGCEINCNNYFIAFNADDKAVGGAAAWIEGEGTQGSNTMRAGLFSYFIPKENWLASQNNLKLVSKHEITRQPGSIQFEDAYVHPDYRGQRIVERIFKHGVREIKKQNPVLTIAQGFTLAGNIQSLISMKKMKWKEKTRIMFETDDVKRLLPGNGKIQWQLDMTDPVIVKDYEL